MLWYAVKAKRRQETHAELSLQRHGVETFYPQLMQSKVIRRKRQTITGPLFPGYLFAKFHFGEQQRAVSYARGVQKIVKFGDTPAIVAEDIIDAIRSRVRDGYVTVPTPTFTRDRRCVLKKVLFRELRRFLSGK
jgi:transcriptional antiterminator RfaH